MINYEKNPFVCGMVCLLGVLLFGSCKKGDTGPQGSTGPQGAAGAQGPQGVAGNANVTMYTYGAQNLSASFVTLQVTTTVDTMNNSAWLVYLYYDPIQRWYSVPGLGYGGATNYRVSMGYGTTTVNIYIDKSGPGENYLKAKVVRIYSNNTIPFGTAGGLSGLPGLPEIDFTDYEVVKSYYHLPE